MNKTMQTVTGPSEFDFTQAMEAAKHYRVSTGIPCQVIDSRGVIQTGEGFQACEICTYLYGEDPARSLCVKTHLYGSYQSERFGGRYHYFCPASLLHWCSPIMYEGRMTGALIAGPVLVFDMEELVNDLFEKDTLSQLPRSRMRKNLEREKICRLFSRIEAITPARAHSLGELLFYTTASLSDQSRYALDRNSEVLEQQSRISEYIQQIKAMEGNPERKAVYPIRRERELYQLISRGDKKSARAVLNEILGNVFFSSGRNFEMVKSRVLELVVLLSRAALEGGADIEQIFGLNYTYIKEINSFRNTDDLAYWLSGILERFTDLVFDLKEIKHTDAIYKAIQYIHGHYAEKISLPQVASEIFLSPGYFSKVFRQEMGSTFIKYLNKVRIERSKTLLRDRNIGLVDIAGMVGYEDQSYFTKVFKKMTGISPGRYRESRGQYPRDTQELHEE